MSAEENKTLVRRMMQEVFEQRNLDAFDRFYTPTYVYHEPNTPPLPPGPEGLRQLFTMYLGAFPDVQATLEDIIAEGDKVVCRLTYRGTHQGELFGIPATGKSVTVPSIVIQRLEGGKIAEEWESVDTLGMMKQLGAIPEAAPAGD